MPVTGGGEDPPAGVRGGPGAKAAGCECREQQRSRRLHPDEQERVVRGVGARERRDVQSAVDMARQGPPGDLGTDDEDGKRDDSTTAEQATLHRQSIIRPRRRVYARVARVAHALAWSVNGPSGSPTWR